ERTTRKFPLLLTTGRILSQYNVGAQTRRTSNVEWHKEDRLEIHPSDAEVRGIKENDWVSIKSRMGETVLRATVTERIQPGVVHRQILGAPNAPLAPPLRPRNRRHGSPPVGPGSRANEQDPPDPTRPHTLIGDIAFHIAWPLGQDKIVFADGKGNADLLAPGR